MLQVPALVVCQPAEDASLEIPQEEVATTVLPGNEVPRNSADAPQPQPVELVVSQSAEDAPLEIPQEAATTALCGNEAPPNSTGAPRPLAVESEIGATTGSNSDSPQEVGLLNMP